MKKTILITGSTDGIGLLTAQTLAAKGHHVILHGRSQSKLTQAESELASIVDASSIESYIADMSDLGAVSEMAGAVLSRHETLDVLINNAGVFKTPDPITASGEDVRFVVNTIAPYLLTQKLLPIIPASGRIINLSSAAQAPVDLQAIRGEKRIGTEFEAYAQSKLAITMWSKSLAESIGSNGPAVIAVNPGSLLGTKMVREGFGTSGHDVSIGSDILTRLSLDDEHAAMSGRYFDNDQGQYSSMHPSGLDPQNAEALVAALNAMMDALPG